MPWIIISLLVLAVLFSYWGYSWESKKSRPRSHATPLVSVIISSYKSPHLNNAVTSAKLLDYPKKEIIVVNDGSEVSFPGVKVINNKKRVGKANALNQATEVAKGEILFYLDADTVAAKDTLKKLIPWFSSGVAAVAPKYAAHNKSNLLTRLIGLEHSFLTTILKIQMYFGTLVSFRGCAVAIKKSALNKVGGWKETMTEDNELAARLIANGYKLMYEPDAHVETIEPDSWSELKRQRLRWGKGSGLSYLSHYKLYMKKPQFSLYVFPYMFLAFVIGVFFLYNSLAILPVASAFLFFTVSFTDLAVFSAFLILPLATSIAVSTIFGAFAHIAIVTKNERSGRDLALILPYVFLFIPLTSYLYLKGILSAARDRKNKKPEVDYSTW